MTDPHVQFDIEVEQAANERKRALTEAQETLELKADTLKAELDEAQKALYLEEIKYNVVANRVAEGRETARRLYNAEVKAIEEDYDDAITESRLRFRQALGHDESA